MAIELDPRATFGLVLSQYTAIEPAEARPTLSFRYPTRRQSKRLAKLQERLEAFTEASDEASAERWADDVMATLEELLAGWEHQVDERGEPLTFTTAGDLDRVIDDGDLGELVARLRTEPLLRVAEKKRSGWRSSSSTATDALDPSQEVADSVAASPSGASNSDALPAKAAADSAPRAVFPVETDGSTAENAGEKDDGS